MNTSKKIIKLVIYFTEKNLYNLTKQETEEKAKNDFPKIVWDDMPQYKGATVGLDLNKFILDNQDNWNEHYKWLKDNSEKLVKFFQPQIVKIKNGL